MYLRKLQKYNENMHSLFYLFIRFYV